MVVFVHFHLIPFLLFICDINIWIRPDVQRFYVIKFFRFKFWKKKKTPSESTYPLVYVVQGGLQYREESRIQTEAILGEKRVWRE